LTLQQLKAVSAQSLVLVSTTKINNIISFINLYVVNSLFVKNICEYLVFVMKFYYIAACRATFFGIFILFFVLYVLFGYIYFAVFDSNVTELTRYCNGVT
jgi:hypothetical protein